MLQNMIEEWRDIAGYEGRYQVSNFGDVRSLPYVNYQRSSHPGIMMEKAVPGKVLRPTGNGHGYLIVGLRYKGGKRKNYYVHRLVAEAFIPNPNGLKEVNHIDYDTLNNAVWNLEWTSRECNIDWSKNHMLHPKKAARKTNIGMKYISKRYGKYRVSIHNKRLGIQFERYFETLEEAITAKEQFINGKEYFAER